MSKNYIKVTFEAWPCELRNSLLIAMQCNICKYCIVVTVICVKYAWHKDGAVLNIDMIQQTCVCSTNNNIHKHPWMLSVSHLDTYQAHGWLDGRTDERMKWQQYPSASMLAKGKSSGNICISNSMPFLPSDLSANVQKPENVVNRPIDGQTDGQKSGRGALLLGGIAMAPSTWFRRKMW